MSRREKRHKSFMPRKKHERYWDRDGKIHTIRTPAGHRRYDIESVINPGGDTRIRILYARFSSYKQKSDLESPCRLLAIFVRRRKTRQGNRIGTQLQTKRAFIHFGTSPVRRCQRNCGLPQRPTRQVWSRPYRVALSTKRLPTRGSQPK